MWANNAINLSYLIRLLLFCSRAWTKMPSRKSSTQWKWILSAVSSCFVERSWNWVLDSGQSSATAGWVDFISDTVQIASSQIIQNTDPLEQCILSPTDEYFISTEGIGPLPCHVPPSCFYSSPEQTNLTPASREFFVCFVFLHFFFYVFSGHCKRDWDRIFNDCSLQPNCY